MYGNSTTFYSNYFAFNKCSNKILIYKKELEFDKAKKEDIKYF